MGGGYAPGKITLLLYVETFPGNETLNPVKLLKIKTNDMKRHALICVLKHISVITFHIYYKQITS